MAKGQFAELTAGLLARKGEALPAAAGFSGHNVVSTTFGTKQEAPPVMPHDDGAGVIDRPVSQQEQAAATAEPSPPPTPKPDTTSAKHADLHQLSPRDAQALIEAKLGVETAQLLDELECDHLPVMRKSDNLKKRAAVTVRLNMTQYLCLKMVGAKMRRTNQDLLVEALDMYLASLAGDELQDCSCLLKLIREELSMN